MRIREREKRQKRNTVGTDYIQVDPLKEEENNQDLICFHVGVCALLEQRKL